jgi:hypothetical protein
MTAQAGYSRTPLARKLGIKPGFEIMTISAPPDYRAMLVDLPNDVTITSEEGRTGLNMVHIFTNRRDELMSELARSVRLIKQDGMIWVSWYKKASKLPTEITEDTIREAAFPLGLVDVKVCAVDEKWSALKLVVRKENRV